jgi:hypothetical protein
MSSGGLAAAYALVALLLAAWIYFAGRLLWMIVSTTVLVSGNTRRARAQLQREAAALTVDQLRTELLHDSYFTEPLRRQTAIQLFLSRIERRDEVALAREYPRWKLYRLLAGAETAAGGSGRPEAVDSIERLFIRLRTLALLTAHESTRHG